MLQLYVGIFGHVCIETKKRHVYTEARIQRHVYKYMAAIEATSNVAPMHKRSLMYLLEF